MTEQPETNAACKSDESTDGRELPTEVVDEVERLVRLEREEGDERERERYEERRAELLEDHEFTSRVRENGPGDVLVLHPEGWHDDGVIRTDRIDDLSRAIEVPLEGAGEPDDWAALDAENRALVATVRDAHGDVHGDNASALADFMGNHYARPLESATGVELEEFLAEYFVRNVWPSKEQRESIEESIELVFETAGEPVPEFRSQ